MPRDKKEYRSDEIKPQNSKRVNNIISNCSVKIQRSPCQICKADGGRTPPSFTSAWSAIWHISHFHREDPRFDDELKKLKDMAKHNYATQSGAN
jgi:hypothetical protein